jgi:ComF family protein
MFDLLFPSYCINCGKPGEYLCSLCKKKLKNTLPECYICRRISKSYKTHSYCISGGINSVFVGWQYNEVAKKILSQFKYRYAYRVSKILSKILLERLEKTGFLKDIQKGSILLPIPSHRSHIKKRGFNQSALIAEHISERLGLEIYKDFMIRDSDSRYQSHLSVKDRSSMGSVFSIKSDIYKKNIILLDDVITTGTTLRRAARCLKGNKIQAIALFRGRPHYSGFDQ